MPSCRRATPPSRSTTGSGSACRSMRRSDLAVNFPRPWAGSGSYARRSSKVETYNFTPTIAYKINDWISVAVGLQAQYMKVILRMPSSAPAPLIGTLNGAGWGCGWTAGVTLTPTADDHDRHRLSLGDQPEDQRHARRAGWRSVSTRGSVNTDDQPAGHADHRLASGHRRPLDVAGRLRMVELEPHRRRDRPATQRRAGDRWRGARHAAVQLQRTAISIRSAPNTSLNPAWTLRAGIAFEKIADHRQRAHAASAGQRPHLVLGRRQLQAGQSSRAHPRCRLLVHRCEEYADLHRPCVGLPGQSVVRARPPISARSNAHVHIISVGLRYQFGRRAGARDQAGLSQIG